MHTEEAHTIALRIAVRAALAVLVEDPTLFRAMQEHALDAGMELNRIEVMRELCLVLGL